MILFIDSCCYVPGGHSRISNIFFSDFSPFLWKKPPAREKLLHIFVGDKLKTWTKLSGIISGLVDLKPWRFNSALTKTLKITFNALFPNLLKLLTKMHSWYFEESLSENMTEKYFVLPTYAHSKINKIISFLLSKEIPTIQYWIKNNSTMYIESS